MQESLYKQGKDKYRNVPNLDRFVNLCKVDLSKKDLSAQVELLNTADFDTLTRWPDKELLPDDFDPKQILEAAKDPGLGLRELHKRGVDGRGVKLAIIDQTLSNEYGELLEHQEYAGQIAAYSEYGFDVPEDTSMHGPAVASLLVGKTCGVVPSAQVVYKAVPCGRDFNNYTKALVDIIEANKKLETKDKVRVVSCSIGYDETIDESGLADWIKVKNMAEEAGIVILDLGGDVGPDYIGGGARADKDNTEEYAPALFYNGAIDITSASVIIPSDFRTMASSQGVSEYMYNAKGGMSWAVPYLAGLYTLAFQVRPHMTMQEFEDAFRSTFEINSRGFKVCSPADLVRAIDTLAD